MSVESKIVKFKDLQFDLVRKENKYVFIIENNLIDLSRFFNNQLTKFNKMSEQEFNDSEGLAILISGEMSCLVHVEKDFNIREIDGKHGWEYWVEEVSEENLEVLVIKIVDFYNEYCSLNIDLNQLDPSEKKAIESFLGDQSVAGKLSFD